MLELSTVILQGSGNLRLAVQLPDGEDTNEWLAVHGGFPISNLASLVLLPISVG